jgi:BirA family biotin operon repressor/biotin-[acetyl-CoA-carboxylase] ligase
MSPSLTAASLSERLAGVGLARHIRFYAELGSTNDEAFDLARQGAPEGTVVVADRQTRGRGRMQRVWVSPPGRNLYLSLVLRPDIAPEQAPQLSIVAGVAAAEALWGLCPGVTLKWPNDVLVRGRKLCGILAEMRAAAGRLDFVILGIGVNVNLLREECPPEIAGFATSLREETGGALSRAEVAAVLLRSLETAYRIYCREGFSPLRARWLERTDMAGKPVRVVAGTDVYEGRMAGLDDAGALLLEEKTGGIRAVMAGDASLVKG